MIAIRFIVAITLLWSTQTVAFVTTPQGVLHDLASCAGRMKAVLDHRVTYNHSFPENIGVGHSRLVEMIDAIIEPDQAQEVLSWRIGARVAQARLLQRAEYPSNEADGIWATDQSEFYIEQCREMFMLD